MFALDVDDSDVQIKELTTEEIGAFQSKNQHLTKPKTHNKKSQSKSKSKNRHKQQKSKSKSKKKSSSSNERSDYSVEEIV